MSMENLMSEFLNKKNTIALVGASNNAEKYGYKVFKDLTDFGYNIIPVNLKEKEIQGHLCYPSLAEVKEKIDVVNFVIPPERTLQVLEECLQLGLKNVWFQPGASDEKVVQFCEQHGFRFIHDACMMVEKLTVNR